MLSARIFRTYYVWPRFPSLSLSGMSCALQCKHCNKVYLQDMQNCSEPDHLLSVCRRIKHNNGVGVLLSGGCDRKGKMLNLRRLLPTIKQVKDETGLIIKLHTGLVDQDLAEGIVEAGVDIASMECVGTDETIQEVLGLPFSTEAYVETFRHLHEAGMPFIVPHVCIGLHDGRVKGELDALQMIKETCDPSVLVFIALKPTPGTPFAGSPIPSATDIKRIVRAGKQLFPDVDLSLGCMRPRNNGREEIELAALQAGVNRMEIPSRATIMAAREMGYEIRRIEACCALPPELEDEALVASKKG